MKTPDTASRLLVAVFAGVIVSATPSYAQQSKEPDVPANPIPEKLDPKACSDRDRLTRGDVQENQGRAPADDNLSDKLARTDGVICPPEGLQPDIRTPAPGGGAIQVIPPPSGTGGELQPRPK